MDRLIDFTRGIEKTTNMANARKGKRFVKRYRDQKSREMQKKYQSLGLRRD